MNRQQRRNFVKKAQKDGMSRGLAKAYVDIANGTGNNTNAKELSEGDKVKLDISAITARKNYKHMSDMYKEFVESNQDKEFTAHIENKNLISFLEEPRWLFWSGDLILIEHDATTEE